MTRRKGLSAQRFMIAGIASLFLFGAAPAPADITAKTSLTDILQRLNPQEQPATLLLSGTGLAGGELYLPDLRGNIRHAEGAAVPLANATVGMDARITSLELSQPLYRSGQGRALSQAEDSRLRAALAQKMDEEQSRNLLIINDYIDTLQLQDQRKIMHNMILSAHKVDMQYSEARQRLSQRAGVDPHTPLAPLDSPALLPQTLQAALAQAEQSHPAVVQAHYECAAAEASSRSLRWEDAPDIDLRGALDRTTNSYTDNDREESGIIGLRATIPLRGDSERLLRLSQAREAAENGRLNIDTTRLAIRQKVLATWDAVQHARNEEKFQSRKATLAEAAAEGRLPKDSRLKAMGSEDAFTRLARQARLAAIAARYSALKAEYALLAATGQLHQALATPAVAPLARQELALDLQSHGNSPAP